MTEELWQEPRLPHAEITELAMGLLTGQAFTNGQIREEDNNLIPIIFMPLGLMSKEQAAEFEHHPPKMVCGWTKDTLGRSINGYPMFARILMIYSEDAALIRACYKKLKAATDEILKA